jgi:sulfite reductase alpha subunit-like flavoprotein
VCKFAAGGSRRGKKDLGAMAMSYGDVYVASIALGANMSQCIRAMVEAEAYPGTSLIIAYGPCMIHGNSLFPTADRDKMAVDSGYWTLYRYNPALRQQGKNPFQLDSKKIRVDLQKFLEADLRYTQLMRNNPSVAKDLNARMKEMAAARFQMMKRRSEEDPSGASTEGKKDEAGLVILFGSETGNSESLANRLAGEAKRRGINATVSAMDDFDFDSLATVKSPVTFILSTCGQGKFPANAEEMNKFLNAQQPGALANLKYSVFGLGDSNYVYFCRSAIDLDKKLEELGATRVCRRGVGNDQDDDKFETGWEEWEPEMWSELKVAPPPLPSGPPEAPYNITLAASGKTEPVVPIGSQPVELKINKRITPMKYDRDIRHMEFDIKGKNMNYAIGDCLAIFGQNDPAMVGDFLGFMGMDGTQVATVAPVSGGALKPGFPNQAMTVNQIFESVLDIFGRPTRRFYNDLALFATNADEKAALLKIGQDKALYKKGLQESVTFADILRQYPSAKPSLAHLIQMLPIIKPRYYSIASSNNMYPDSLHLCVVLVDWKTPSGKLRKGLTTSYIARANPEQGPTFLNCAVRRSAVEMPPSQMNPVIMAGLGTGVAPFRAFVQDRAFYARKGDKVGPMVLYYGCRFRKQDFLYCEEFEQYEKEGVICQGGLRPACSRDQEKKIYCQHLIVEDAKRTHDFLMKEDGYFYICGPSRGVPEDVRNAVAKSLMQEGGMTKEQAEKTITDMVIKGRYNVEAWS